MNFLFVSTMAGWAWGGSEELWSQSASRLHREGHQVSASVSFWPRLAPQVQGLREQGIKLFVRTSRRSRLPARLLHRVTHGCLDRVRAVCGKPDLVVISQGMHTEGLEWMEFCCGRGLPFVVIVHSVQQLWWPHDELADRLAKAYRAARRVFNVSHYGQRLLEQHIGEPLKNAETVWNPYNVATDPAPVWPGDHGTWRLACVGLLNPAVKGHDLLFEVLALPQWRDRPVELNLYGDGPCRLGLGHLAQRLNLGNIHFHGRVSDIRGVWELNHLLVMPSRYEGLPLSLIESMWCARPAIITDVGGVTEVCVDGETGFIVPAATAPLLQTTMEEAWARRNAWEAMGKAARARAEQLVPRDCAGVFGRRLVELAQSDDGVGGDAKRDVPHLGTPAEAYHCAGLSQNLTPLQH